MAMLVILYFFSGNLNFFSKNKTLKVLAYVWIVQNTFLVFSVLIRDYHYINLSGLTYKRIGVLVFSLLCCIGLLTVYLKVAKQKTLFYLFKTNGDIWYALLILAGFVNWDVYIVDYNLSKRSTAHLDVTYLMNLSDKTLPQLIENKELLKASIIDTTKIKDQIQQSLQIKFEQDLKNKAERFVIDKENRSWLSWNYPDWQTAQFLNEQK